MDTEWLRFSMFAIPFVGLYFFIAGISGLKEYFRIKKLCTEIDAEIIDFEQSIDEGSDLFAPIFRYTHSEKVYTNTSTTSSGKKPKLHSYIKIKIDPDNPQDSYIDSKFRTFAYFFIPFAGILMLVIGVVISNLLLGELF